MLGKEAESISTWAEQRTGSECEVKQGFIRQREVGEPDNTNTLHEGREHRGKNKGKDSRLAAS